MLQIMLNSFRHPRRYNDVLRLVPNSRHGVYALQIRLRSERQV